MRVDVGESSVCLPVSSDVVPAQRVVVNEPQLQTRQVCDEQTYSDMHFRCGMGKS